MGVRKHVILWQKEWKEKWGERDVMRTRMQYLCGKYGDFTCDVEDSKKPKEPNDDAQACGNCERAKERKK